MLLSQNSPDRKTLFVDVILPIAIPKTYTYRIPVQWNERIKIGIRVIVQFGRSKLYSAIVKRISSDVPKLYEAKYILDIVDNQSIVTDKQLDFWAWMSSYYMCHIGEVMQAGLPTALKLESETLISAVSNEQLNRDELTDKEYMIVEALDVSEELKIGDVVKLLGQKTVFPLLRGLYDKGFIHISEQVSKKFKPRVKKYIELHPNVKTEDEKRKAIEGLNNAPKQQDTLLAYIHLARKKSKISRKKLMETAQASSAIIKALGDKGILREYEEAVSRLDKNQKLISSNFILNDEQKKAFDETFSIFEKDKVALLHGVTASGKTQVYIRVIEHFIRQGKTALYLLPEIALTSQITERLKIYFGDQLVVYHSRFNENERVEVWEKVLNKKCKVILGARSAIFLPFQNLGVVVVDEEHESSYKQYEPSPRYHARDSAIYLAQMFDAKVLLGSATPSIESYYNAKSKKYGLIELKSRYGEAAPPELEIVDIKEKTRKDQMLSYFSSPLMEAIQNALLQKEQIILFQNRRGHSTFLQCKTCGHVVKCVNCDVAMTYHKTSNLMHCHYCGYSDSSPQLCTACGSPSVQSKGYGTERIEEELELLMPDARIARLDLDTTRGKYGFDKLINAFEDHEIDILIGTQMVAKGLDFGRVSVIGIINADSIINFPDFRSYERAYSLFSQVSGRAGRRDIPGKVYIQTYSPDHRVLKQVLGQKYLDMFAAEIKERKNFHYPPFYRLIRLEVRHTDIYHCESSAHALATQIKEYLKDRVLGPEPPLVSRVRKNYLQVITLKIERTGISIKKVKEMLKDTLLYFQADKKHKGVRVYIDVDPL